MRIKIQSRINWGNIIYIYIKKKKMFVYSEDPRGGGGRGEERRGEEGGGIWDSLTNPPPPPSPPPCFPLYMYYVYVDTVANAGAPHIEKKKGERE